MRDRAPSAGRDEVITSPSNPTVRLARSLHRRRMRHRERALLVEGRRAIQTALDFDARVRAALIDASRSSELDPAFVERLRGAAGRTLQVDARIFQTIADTEHPQSVIAVCDTPELQLPVNSAFVVAVDGVRDPGNLGALIRSCAAAGVDGVALLRGTADPTNPKVVRASAGTIFALPVDNVASVEDVAMKCFAARPLVAYTDAAAERAYDDVDWTAQAILVIGGEAGGVSEDARTFADLSVAIPMVEGVESLNAAVAASVIVFEVNRQRRHRR
jgi:TrmH family RNA methyltransferase